MTRQTCVNRIRISNEIASQKSKMYNKTHKRNGKTERKKKEERKEKKMESLKH